MDWQVGDLAVCVNAGPCPKCEGTKNALLTEGSVYTISFITRDDLGLVFDLAEVVPPTPTWAFCAEHFSKIRPDEREACEPEFVTLLKRSKRKVSA